MLVLLGRGTAAQVGRLDRLYADRVVRAHEGERSLVVEVAPLSAHVLMLLGKQLHRLAVAVAPPASPLI